MGRPVAQVIFCARHGLGSETGRSASVEFNSLVNVAVVTLLSGPVPVLYELRRRQLAGFERRVDI